MDTIVRQLPEYDVVVAGAGHAGCEAGLAAARAGCRTLVVTPNLDRVGYMPCNPSIGGPGKSHIVAEIDALGGEMARAADRAMLQIRLLNTSKGPAVQALRAQEDKSLYALAIKEALELQPNLELCQDEIVDVMLFQKGRDQPAVNGVVTRSRGRIPAKAVVITAGTFLRGALVAGETRSSGGRAGEAADNRLAGSLCEIGFQLRRLKTGTPPRIDARTVDFTACEPQDGSETPLWFSRDGAAGELELLTLPPLSLHRVSPNTDRWHRQLACFRVSTMPDTHDLIRANLGRAPMFNGSIEGIGPRYCPSIEDKVARFPDKASHPIFIEPEGWRTAELYVQGFSTSLPFDVQDAALRTIPAFRHARVTRYGYAVEYDAVDPGELTLSLESKRIRGLFLAGQVNGTSGYEEAAGQGIVAGVNAANRVRDMEPLVLGRDRAYIGVMIDDLVSKPFDEPYRMLTSRAEYRLHLRVDTADDRLADTAADHGLIRSSRLNAVNQERVLITQIRDRLAACRISPSPRDSTRLRIAGIEPPGRPVSAVELLRRPEVTFDQIAALIEGMPPALSSSVRKRVEDHIKYEAFVEREEREIARRASLEHRPLSPTLDYAVIDGLRFEARAKLAQTRPTTFGQASRLSGVTPADMAVLLIHAARHEAAAECAS
ncbi:MAG: tRNA uridine-5-carboxymethylaminomethyl(34) synthesis enzyme MnmG [Thermomicrobiales bacterium]